MADSAKRPNRPGFATRAIHPGLCQSFHDKDASSCTLEPIVRENLSREARMMSDKAIYYTKVGREFTSHGTVRHNQGEYGRVDTHTNTIEGYFSISKKGMKGVYQHCGKQHLHRYLAEFNFRYNQCPALGVDDRERAKNVLRGVDGKRLTSRNSSAASMYSGYRKAL